MVEFVVKGVVKSYHACIRDFRTVSLDDTHTCAHNIPLCIYIRTYVCIILMYVCMYVCMHVYPHVCFYVCIYVCMYLHTCVCVERERERERESEREREIPGDNLGYWAAVGARPPPLSPPPEHPAGS